MANARVLVCAGDPGGAAALTPVVLALSESPTWDVVAAPYREAAEMWCATDIALRDVSPDVSVLTDLGIDCVLTATSINGEDRERGWIAAACAAGIPSLTHIDFWSNYAKRFGAAPLPTRIAVIDALARDEAIEDGLPAERIVVTGTPAFDSLADDARAFGADRRAALRERLGVRDDGLLVFFPSQPISTVCGTTPDNPLFIGYTERDVLPAVLSALEPLATERPIMLVLKAHPREDGAWLHGIRGRAVDVRVAADTVSRELAMAAELTVGMDSMLLAEVCYLGCVVLSVQPDLIGTDPLPTNRAGISRSTYRYAQLPAEVAACLLDNTLRTRMRTALAHWKAPTGATQRVIDELRRLNDDDTRD